MTERGVTVDEDSWEAGWDEPADQPNQAEADLQAADDALIAGEQNPPDEPLDGQGDPAPAAGEASEANPVVDALRHLGETQRQYADSVQQSVGSLADQLRQVNAEAAVARQTPGGPSQEEIDRASKDPESWENFKKEWDTWAKPIEDLFDHRVKAALAAAGNVDVAKIIEQVRDSVRADVKREVDEAREQERADLQVRQEYVDRIAKGRAKVKEIHKDFNLEAPPAEFDQWLATTAPGIRALRNSLDPDDAITMINLYKAARPSVRTAASVQAARTQRVQRSAVPSRTVAHAPTHAVDTRNMSWDEEWDYHDKLKEAQARRTPQARA